MTWYFLFFLYVRETEVHSRYQSRKNYYNIRTICTMKIDLMLIYMRTTNEWIQSCVNSAIWSFSPRYLIRSFKNFSLTSTRLTIELQMNLSSEFSMLTLAQLPQLNADQGYLQQDLQPMSYPRHLLSTEKDSFSEFALCGRKKNRPFEHCKICKNNQFFNS